MKEILAWTGGKPFLTQKLCKLVRLLPFSIPAGSEAEWVEKLVRARIIENWEAQDEPEHLKTIRARLLRNEKRAGSLLSLYGQVLRDGGVPADGDPEQLELRLSGFAVRHSGRLLVANRIYGEVFNLSWVEKELANLRPYSEAFKGWVDSGCQDSSRLLRGRALQEALAWAADKRLSDRDYQFLAAGQEVEKREVLLTLEAEKEAGRSLSEANQTHLGSESESFAQTSCRCGGAGNFLRRCGDCCNDGELFRNSEKRKPVRDWNRRGVMPCESLRGRKSQL